MNLKKTAKCADLFDNGFYFIHNICYLLFNVVDRPEVRVEMLKTNRNDVVEQSLGEVNLAMMASLTMVIIKTGLKVKVFILSNTNPCESSKKFCCGVSEDLSHFLSECVGDQKEKDKPPMIIENESSLLHFTWPK